ncbi:hypothetical protein BcepF1.060 [Burkholderia phage BcepF1]|uniref:Uncharacterized protein n=1 Tax=Burkholderia phage BcepF1 TaxID=2886897 RepID=A1YZW4_9CAUD|nr:hypothetical protein BcepF1.060 [Burkholderia phage BcepF1]ABL96791.1 hypothetical protein BcepF1.060 [Burkholderia phage BcepF1]
MAEIFDTENLRERFAGVVTDNNLRHKLVVFSSIGNRELLIAKQVRRKNLAFNVVPI